MRRLLDEFHSSFLAMRESVSPSPVGRVWRLAEAFLLWGVLAALLFLAFGAVERLWLSDLDSEHRNIAHLVRGIVISFITTVATATYLLRRVVPSLSSSLGAESAETRPDLSGRLGIWLVGMRWVALLALTAVVASATVVADEVPLRSWLPLWSAVALLGLCNSVFAMTPRDKLATQRALLVQIAVDVGTLGWLVHFAGGFTNPFSGFFVLHAIVAAVVLPARPARGVAAAISAFIVLLSALEASGVLSPTCLRSMPGLCEDGAGWMHMGASGLAAALMVMGSSLMVVPLVGKLHDERLRLADAMADVSQNAERLVQARAEVQAEREKLQSIIDCMADAVLFVTPDGALRLKNRAAEQIFASQAARPGDIRLCHRPHAWERMLARLTDPEPVESHPLIQVEGRSYEPNYAPVSDAEGRCSGVVMVARDVTERIEAQKRQVDQERMSVVGKLAAGLAHEINNPLGAMVLFTQHALKRVDASDPLADHLQTVLRNANHCKKIVKDLLQYARQRPPELTEIRAAELFGDVIRTLCPQAERSHVEIEDAIEDADGFPLYGDPDQLRQVLMNLGLNAIEAMPQGGRLSFRVRRETGGKVALEVADTGPGIPTDVRERIFSAFFTTKPEGTGLGLAVARELVAAHGGSLEFESEPGQGTTFRAILPMRREATA